MKAKGNAMQSNLRKKKSKTRPGRGGPENDGYKAARKWKVVEKRGVSKIDDD